MTAYSFGDTELAAERLRVLDRVFGSTADDLLAELDVAPARVADLGCGPGQTTARLIRRFPGASVVGVDASDGFIDAARASVPAATFVVGDVTEPLPGAPYDFAYARFLLAHLPEVSIAITQWTNALTRGGVLVLEETEHISTDDEWFARYEVVSVARVAASGADVYAGPAISASLPVEGSLVAVDRIIDVDVTAGEAAGMFWRNLATWGHDAVADGLLTEPDRANLLAHLRDRETDTTTGLFTWTHHQTVLRTG